MPGSVSSFEGIDSGGLAPNPDRSTPLSGASSGITGLLEGSQNDAERIQNAIKEAFQLLDANRCGRIVADIYGLHLEAFSYQFRMRMFNLCATTTDTPGEVPLDKFQQAVLEFVAAKKYVPPDQELLLAAFAVLDPGRTGFVNIEELRALLGGAPDGLLREMDDFMGYAMAESLISEEGKFNYYEYVRKTSRQISEHLHKVIPVLPP